MSTIIVGEGANHYSLALDREILDRIRDALAGPALSR